MKPGILLYLVIFFMFFQPSATLRSIYAVGSSSSALWALGGDGMTTLIQRIRQHIIPNDLRADLTQLLGARALTTIASRHLPGVNVIVRLHFLDPFLCSLLPDPENQGQVIAAGSLIRIVFQFMLPELERLILEGRDFIFVEEVGIGITLDAWLANQGPTAGPSDDSHRLPPPELSNKDSLKRKSFESNNSSSRSDTEEAPQKENNTLFLTPKAYNFSDLEHVWHNKHIAFGRGVQASNATVGTKTRVFPVDSFGDCDVSSVILMTSMGPSYSEQSVHGLQFLNPTDKIWSPSTRFFLVMQLDCNLVLYDNSNYKPLWATNTNGMANVCYATITVYGDLQVIGEDEGTVLWNTNTRCTSKGGDCWTNMILQVQDDGNLVLYIMNTLDPAWQSNTVQCNGGC